MNTVNPPNQDAQPVNPQQAPAPNELPTATELMATVRVRLAEEQAALLVDVHNELTAPADTTVAQRAALAKVVTRRNESIERLRRTLASLEPSTPVPTAPTRVLDPRFSLAKRTMIIKVAETLGLFKGHKEHHDKTLPLVYWSAFAHQVADCFLTLEEAKSVLHLVLQKHPLGLAWFENNVRNVKFANMQELKARFLAQYLATDWKTSALRSLYLLQHRREETLLQFLGRFEQAIYANEMDWENNKLDASHTLLVELLHSKLPPSVHRSFHCKPASQFASLRDLSHAASVFVGIPDDVTIQPAQCGNCDRVLSCPKCDTTHLSPNPNPHLGRPGQEKKRDHPEGGHDKKDSSHAKKDLTSVCKIHGPGHSSADCQTLKRILVQLKKAMRPRRKNTIISPRKVYALKDVDKSLSLITNALPLKPFAALMPLTTLTTSLSI